jgi:hypothetical protein
VVVVAVEEEEEEGVVDDLLIVGVDVAARLNRIFPKQFVVL